MMTRAFREDGMVSANKTIHKMACSFRSCLFLSHPILEEAPFVLVAPIVQLLMSIYPFPSDHSNEKS